jgi:hypothetical protein
MTYTPRVPVLSATDIELILSFVGQYKDEKVWGRKGKRAHHVWHLLPSLYKGDRLEYISICGIDVQSRATVYCFNPLGRKEHKCDKCLLIDTMRGLAE